MIELSPWCKVVAGTIGACAEAVAMFPMDTVKTRIQLDTSRKCMTISNCVLQTMRGQGGVLSLYNGLTPFVSQLVLKYAYRFGSFGWLQRQLGENKYFGTNTAMLNFVAGSIVGASEAVLVVTPFEVIKTRLQNNVMGYKGPLNCAVTIIRDEGAAALLQGVTPTVIRQGSNQAFNFMCFSALNERLWNKQEGDGRQLDSWKIFSSGIIAGAIGPCFNAPMDVVKTRLMAQTSSAGQPCHYQGFLHCLRTITHEEGALALWKGLLPRLLRIAPGQAITWTVVTKMTSYFEKWQLQK